MPVTGTGNTPYSPSIWAPGTRWFTLETPGMTPYHPLNHVPWVVFRIYSPRNPFQNENAVSQCLTPHTSLAVRSAGPAAQLACTDRRLIQVAKGFMLPPVALVFFGFTRCVFPPFCFLGLGSCGL